MSELNFLEGVQKFSEGMGQEEAPRIENGEKWLSFGNTFLDDAFGGIFNNDLILFGSKTGRGKTQLVTQIAQTNARRGKRVLFFALEAERYEIERRAKYQAVAEWFFSQPPNSRPKINLNYTDWYYGRLHHHLADVEKEISKKLAEIYSTLSIYYTTKDFTADDFERIVFALKDETDLFILDHLHYFEFNDDNENRGMKTTVKAIRDVCLISGKPVILVAHLRKEDKRFKQPIPDLEDFHGSSDIGKIAVKAFTIAPVVDSFENKPFKQTYFKILKNRVDGGRLNSIATIGYNLSTQTYERKYFIGEIERNGDGPEFVPYPPYETPFWCKHAEN